MEALVKCGEVRHWSLFQRSQAKLGLDGLDEQREGPSQLLIEC